jgi:hypothetical protein
MVSLVPQKVPQKVPQGLSVRGCLLVFSHVKKPGFSRILDSHEHTRTPYLYLGVKGSQVQILSARQYKSPGFTRMSRGSGLSHFISRGLLPQKVPQSWGYAPS